MKTLASDNNSGIHPDILQAIINANEGHALAYGDDKTTKEAILLFKEHFGNNIDVYFTYNGTGANVVALATILKSYEAVICAESAHINVDECGAAERLAGCKLITIPTSDGKLTVEQIKTQVKGMGDEHHVQVRAISITQVTERGTCYTVDELKAITDYAHQNNLLVHVDGARIANAAAHLNTSLKAITTDVGIDVLSFGGTKNGMMGGEAVVFFNPELSKNAKYIRKQFLHLASKMRFVSAQFIALLSNDLWRKNAEHSNAMAGYLAKEIQNISGVHIKQKVESNAIFAKIPEELIKPLQAATPFYTWDETCNEVRWVCSFDTTKAEIDGFVEKLSDLLKEAEE